MGVTAEPLSIFRSSKAVTTPTKCLSRNASFDNCNMGNAPLTKNPEVMNSLPANDAANLVKVEKLCNQAVGYPAMGTCVQQHLTEEEIRSLTESLSSLGMSPLGGPGRSSYLYKCAIL